MWYYEKDGEQIGPVEKGDIAGLILGCTVKRDTLVWKDGMPDWVPAGQTELFIDPVSPPAVPTEGGGAGLPMPPPAPYEAASFRTLWLWYVWLIGVGLPLCVVFVGILPLIAGLIVGYILLYRYWDSIQDGYARTTPGKAVGFCFIPFFNIYWLYVATVGLAQDMNSYCERYDVEGPRVNEGMVLAAYILSLCSAIPYLGVLVAIAAVVLQIIVYKQFADVSAAIREAAGEGEVAAAA